MTTKSYGILQKEASVTDMDLYVEMIKRDGFSVINSGFSQKRISLLKNSFDEIHQIYLNQHGEAYLRSLDEHNTVRMPMQIDMVNMLTVATCDTLLEIIDKLITGTYILNQQNLIINPSNQDYNQSAWHRDLPYQHFVSSTPLAVNAIYCVDDFTKINGASYVLPGTHKSSSFPSDAYIQAKEIQIEAPAGSFVVIDCMTYHRGGRNYSDTNRRGINQVYTIPYFKQQISIPKSISLEQLTSRQKALLGAELCEPENVNAYLNTRKSKLT